MFKKEFNKKKIQRQTQLADIKVFSKYNLGTLLIDTLNITAPQ